MPSVLSTENSCVGKSYACATRKEKEKGRGRLQVALHESDHSMASSPDAVAGASLPTTSTARALSEEENTPVEMSTLNAASRNDVAVGTPGSLGGLEDAVQTQPAVAASMATEPAPAIAGSSQPVSTTSASAPPPQDNLRRTETEHLGPAIESDAPLVPSSTVSAGPVLMISLMLITGARHPYKIDEKYLRNRKVIAQDSSGAFNPRELSGYQLKELIWTDWRQEWEPRPSSPGRIRLIVMGRMIEDKGLLKGEICLRDSSTRKSLMSL